MIGYLAKQTYSRSACSSEACGVTSCSLALAHTRSRTVYYADEVAIAPINRKQKRRFFADPLRFREIDRGLTEDTNCSPVFVSGKQMQCFSARTHSRCSPE